MHNFCYKWLPIIFGCHCRSDRSFFYKGQQFPICARCTGELIGILLSFILWFVYPIPFWLCFILMLPMIIDGFTQSLTSYESCNTLRFITGCLFGYALMSLIIIGTVMVGTWGYEYGLQLSTHKKG